MRLAKSSLLSMILLLASLVLLVRGYVILGFPVTIKVSVREPLVVTGPTPANGTLFASSSKNFTLSFKNQAGPVSGSIYFTSNQTGGWNCSDCGIGPQPFTMRISGQLRSPANYCGNPVAEGRCGFGYIVPSGQSELIATLTAESSAPIVDFTINFFFAR